MPVKESTPLKQRGTTPEYGSQAKTKKILQSITKPQSAKVAPVDVESLNDITIADEQGMNQPRVSHKTILASKS
jgi:hypothetical protein